MNPSGLLALALMLAAPEGALTVDECVEIALKGSAQIAEVEARVDQWKARLAEVESVYWPKIDALGWIAPMFTVRGDINGVERDYSKWGPYTHLEATLAWPVWSFGRVEAGERAAEARTAVERARVRETRNAVALEVRRFYYLHLYALSMLPSLKTALDAVTEARETGQEMYDDSTGEVTQADLMKLEYGLLEITRLMRIARDGAELAKEALNHTMGRPATAPLTLAAQKLPKPTGDVPALAELYQQAAEGRPEWAQIREGKKATLALEDAESLAMAPVAFVAGRISHDWAPTRDDTDNPYHYDRHNDLDGGAAVGLQWQFDPVLALAKAEGARARHAEVEALERFAQTGIPLQVRKAHDDLRRHLDLYAIGRKQVKATRRWMTFAAAAYKTGTGEARDLLEGLVAYLTARKTAYEHLRDAHIARAELVHATGAAERTALNAEER